VTNAPLIAIIDDDANVREALADLLESYGFRTSTFDGAPSFLSAQVAADCQCIITDLQMANMTGIQLAQHLVSEAVSTPIILITAFSTDAVRRAAAAIGISHLLPKPLNPVELLACIKAVLPSV